MTRHCQLAPPVHSFSETGEISRECNTIATELSKRTRNDRNRDLSKYMYVSGVIVPSWRKNTVDVTIFHNKRNIPVVARKIIPSLIRAATESAELLFLDTRVSFRTSFAFRQRYGTLQNVTTKREQVASSRHI